MNQKTQLCTLSEVNVNAAGFIDTGDTDFQGNTGSAKFGKGTTEVGLITASGISNASEITHTIFMVIRYVFSIPVTPLNLSK